MDEIERGMEETEQQLRHYRPVGPPPKLRSRVVGGARPPRTSLWMWLPTSALAAAALILMIVSANARRGLAAEFAPPAENREAVANAVAAELGGDPAVRALVARLIELDEREGTFDQDTAARPEGSRHE